MKKVFCLFSAALVVSATVSCAQPQQDKPTQLPAVDIKAQDNKALAVVDAMSQMLDSQDMFEFTVTDCIDRMEDDDYLVQYSHQRSVTVQRPDRVFVSTTGDLEKENIYYDGREVIISLPDENVFARTQVPPTIETMMKHMRTEYGVRRPAMEFAVKGVGSLLKENADYSRYIGTSTVNGIECDHLLFAFDNAELQLWISSQGKPLPQKMLVRYVTAPGNPCYTAYFDSWEFPETIDNGIFQFNPSEDAEQIPFARPDEVAGGSK